MSQFRPTNLSEIKNIVKNNGACLNILIIGNYSAAPHPESLGGRLPTHDHEARGARQQIALHIALTDLSLEKLWVVHPGKDEYPVEEKITVCPRSKLEFLTNIQR